MVREELGEIPLVWHWVWAVGRRFQKLGDIPTVRAVEKCFRALITDALAASHEGENQQPRDEGNFQ